MSKKGNKYKFALSSSKSANASKYTLPVSEITFHAYHPYFSFRYYHNAHRDYTFANFNKDEFIRFVNRLKDMSQLTWKDVLIDQSKFWHAHAVDWSETAVPAGFSHLPLELKNCPVYQFKVFEGCRVFGFINHHNVFKIVWIDKDHKIYPKK
jgi:hypothetical protein